MRRDAGDLIRRQGRKGLVPRGAGERERGRSGHVVSLLRRGVVGNRRSVGSHAAAGLLSGRRGRTIKCNIVIEDPIQISPPMFMRTGVLATAWHLLGPAPAAAAQTPAILDSIDRLSGRRSPATPTSSITCPRPTVPYTSPGRSGNSSRPELTRHRALRSGLARGRVRLLFILTMTIRWLLAAVHLLALGVGLGAVWARGRALQAQLDVPGLRRVRSEERRVGKECRSRWSPYH